MGTQMLNQRLQASNTDNMVMLAGLTQGARIPSRRLRRRVRRRVSVDAAQHGVEYAGARARERRPGRARVAEAAPAVQPREIYQTEITNALVNAILDYTGSIGVAPANG